MKERLKLLNGYEKGLLVTMAGMLLVFAVCYYFTISRVGFAYRDAILVPHTENGDTIYSGKIQGELAEFTVTAEKDVLFCCGDRTYGPYSVTEDPAAVPEGDDAAEKMTGVVVRSGDEILFRGGVWNWMGTYWLTNADGTNGNIHISYVSGDGVTRDENGDPLDPVEPEVSTILQLLDEPELTHKGHWGMWWLALAVSLLNAGAILFADEIFRWNLAFQIQDVESAEPSDTEIAGRYIGWTAMALFALILLIRGLQM